MEAKFFQFPNVGFTEQKLSKEVLDRLRRYIKNKKEKVNYTLAGNIKSSYELEDKNDWFFKSILIPNVVEFEKHYKKEALVPNLLTKNCAYELNRFWVNFQKKYEFNPIHDHSGVFSFVIWMKIPSSFKKECRLPFVKDASQKSPNTFQFLFSDSLGHISTFDYPLEPSNEGTMLFFPSGLNHAVYPFYTSNKERISISGNINLNPEEIIKRKDL